MPSLRHIRKRIQAVKNTEQITRAMKMVAAAKFRRAQEILSQARPFARQMQAVLTRLASLQQEAVAHPLLELREKIESEDLIVLTADRGLCGSFNSNVIRRVEHYLLDHAERREKINLITIGMKGYRYFARQKHVHLEKNLENLLAHPDYHRAVEISEELAERYQSGRVDRVTVVFNEFRSAVQQAVTFRTLLPLEKPPAAGDQPDYIDYLYEPEKTTLIDRLIHRYLANQFFLTILESVASEHGARMTAMENASDNAREMIGRLTLIYNKARQASITKELMEIVGGAEALKG
jgi:F-type H+-transporting ATPase subunit gamma